MRGLFLKDNNKCLSSHLFHINCHQVVDLVSYFHLCPTLLRRYINRWDHCPDESTVKLSNVFVFYLERDCEDYLAVCRLDAVAV